MKIYFDSFSESRVAFDAVVDALEKGHATNIIRISRSAGAEEIQFREGDFLSLIQFRVNTGSRKTGSERCKCACST